MTMTTTMELAHEVKHCEVKTMVVVLLLLQTSRKSPEDLSQAFVNAGIMICTKLRSLYKYSDLRNSAQLGGPFPPKNSQEFSPILRFQLLGQGCVSHHTSRHITPAHAGEMCFLGTIARVRGGRGFG
jgi:hypothetical protein